MEVAQIVALLGRPSTDPEVVHVLAAFDIDDQPQPELDDKAVDGPVVRPEDWLLNAMAGIEFGFEDEAAFRGLDDAAQGKGPMLLTQIYFYVNHDNVRPYARTLPFNLGHNDTRDAVRHRLREYEKQRRSYQRDVWALEPFTLVVSYTKEFSAIDCVLCMLHKPLLPPPASESPPLPSLAAIIALFSKKRRDPEIRAVFAPFGLDRDAEYLQNPYIADFRRTYGFELDFADPDFGLTGITLFRERMRDARGWAGELPLGLRFDDSPETVLAKMQVEPNERFDDDVTGWMLWNLRGCSVRVHYSSLDNVILDVRMAAPRS